MDRVDDAGAASGEAAVDCLRVLQVWIQTCALINEPGPQMPGGVLRITLVMGQQPRGGERRHCYAQPHQGASMIVEVIRVRQTVALNVGTAGIRRIRPPVVSFGKVIVRPAGAAWAVRGGDRQRLLRKIFVGCTYYSGAL